MTFRLRAADTSDEDALPALAPRLQIGVAPWRDHDAVGETIRSWITASLVADGSKACWLAEEHGDGASAVVLALSDATITW